MLTWSWGVESCLQHNQDKAASHIRSKTTPVTITYSMKLIWYEINFLIYFLNLQLLVDSETNRTSRFMIVEDEFKNQRACIQEKILLSMLDKYCVVYIYS